MSKGTLLAKFATLGAQRLQRLQNLVVRLEQGGDPAIEGREAQRDLHTLKGEARILGLDRTAQLAHAVEEVLHRGLAGGALSHESARALLFGLDRLGAAVAGIAQGTEPEMDLASIVQELGVGEYAGPAAGVPSLPPASPMASLQDRGPAAAPGALSLATSQLDELTRLLGELRALHTRFRFVTTALRGIDERLSGRSARLRELASGAIPGEARGAGAGPAKHDDEVRRLAREGYVAARAQLFEHESLLERLDHFTWSLRVVPIDPQLLRHPRAIRDLAVTLGKKVLLDIREHGAHVERPVLEVIDDIAVHLLHNAVDHGIEAPAARVRAGKPEVGRVTLAVRSLGAQVELTVEDDGRGIDPDGLRRAAVASRALSAEAAEGADDAEIMELLFAPGFTTRDQVTEVSGRGVGLDAVRDRASSIGGTVTLSSTPGRGTTFRALLPARVTMTRVLLVSAAGSRLAIPAQSVRTVLALTRSEVEVAAGSLFIRLDGEPIPLLDLARSVGEAADGALPDPIPVVIVSRRGDWQAFAVDRVLGAREAVQLPPGRLLEDHAFVRSLALLDDGEVALSIDTGALPAARISARRLTGESGASAAAQPSTGRASILVVDDSEVTRDVIAEVMRDAGYEVTEAVDGRQALDRIAASRPSLLITDLQMPVMDGFALMRAVRGNPAWKDMAMIVVSTLGSEADRTQAARAGADAYVVKADLRREVLLAAVSRFVRPPPRGAS